LEFFALMLTSVFDVLIHLNAAQWVGLLAYGVGITAFFHHDGRRFRLHLMAFQVVATCHFVMMGAMVGASGSAISGARSYLSTRTQSSTVMWIFIALLWIMGLLNLKHSFEILTFVGASVATWAMFKTQGLTLRLLILSNSVCWFTHNLLIGSIGATLMEGSFALVNTVMIVRMIWTKYQTDRVCYPDASS
jgi:hypothetical protein